MTQEKKRKIAVVELIVMVALVAWAIFPRPLERAMGGDFDPAQLTAVQVVLRNGDEKREAAFTPGTTDCDIVMGLLTAHKYIPLYLENNAIGYSLDWKVDILFQQGEDTYSLTFTGDDVTEMTNNQDRTRSFRTSVGVTFQQDVVNALVGYTNQNT